MKPIGVLALQGAFDAHAVALRDLGHEVLFVRSPPDLARVGGLVLPGGESTVQRLLLDESGLTEPVRAFAAAGQPILATCAGLILAARCSVSSASDRLGREGLRLLDVDVLRNAYGRQLDSFEARDDADRYAMIFIRAPRIQRVGAAVEVLAKHAGEPVLVRQGAIVGATFHPELTEERAIHALAFARASQC